MEERNLAELFRNRSRTHAALTRWRQRIDGAWHSATYAENAALVYQVAAGLQKLGIAQGDRVGILGNSSAKWLMADWAVWCVGGVSVTIYPSLLADTIAYIANDSGTRFIFAEDAEQIAKLKGVRAQLSGVERVIVFDDAAAAGDDWLLSFKDLCALDSRPAAELERLVEERIPTIGIDDLATIVYTSGTTGNPKGAMLSHRCFIAQLEDVRDRMPPFTPGSGDLLFLPAAHIFGRVQHTFGLERGLTTTIVNSIKTVIEDVQESKPAFFFSVPRIYEKIFSTARARAEAKPATKRIFNWALGVGREMSQAKQNKTQPGALLKFKHGLADKLVFHKVRNLLGGNIVFAITGGAPLDVEILEFFNGAGVMLLEGWGLTETTAPATFNTPTDYRLGTVGKPSARTEIKIASDGEILVRSPINFQGYYNSPQKTAEAITEDGWFHTGDIGEFDSDGFLRITDRKKDILVTAAGKNIAPQAVEAAFKNSAYISQCAVYGDRKPYLVALLTLDPEAMKLWSESEGITISGPWSDDQRVQALIAEEVKQANATLPSFEQVKYYRILPEDFSIENGLLTPTLKLRRRHIYEQFQGTYEDLYK